MKKLIIIFIISVIANFGFLNAQDSYTSFQYAIGFGTGDLGDHLNKTSSRGFLFAYNKSYGNENLYVGFDLAWNTFYEEKDYGTYTIEDASLSGKQWRYNNQFPILISADYFLQPDSDFSPYINFGLGTMYSKRRTDMGVYMLEQDAWHFALKPEIGAVFDMGNNSGFKLAAKYYTGFKSGDLETQSYFVISAGLLFNF